MKPMKKTIENILRDVVGNETDFQVSVPEFEKLGHYSTNIALRLAKIRGENPVALAEKITREIHAANPSFFERVEAAPPGFVNFWISKNEIQKEFSEIAKNGGYGTSESMKGKTVMIEYTDPNPFKLFHIGHLMSNAIGESIARLHEVAGARVIRVNYQGDIGLHVAKAIWAVIKLDESVQKMHPDSTPEKIVYDWEDLVNGKAYRMGNDAYERDQKVKAEVIEINKKLYEKSDNYLNQRYLKGREESLKHLRELYKRLGTKFNHDFFESEVADDGIKIVAEHPDIFVKSDGAVVFRGEDHNLHTRVFVNTQGLPTYEAKELGVNKKKFELYHPDFSIIVTGNEVNDYFRVLLKAMELVLPEIASRTRHIGHGMLRLPTGKMSSRTGTVITAEEFIEQAKHAIKDRENAESDLNASEREASREAIAIGAIKYSILKQSIGQDIVFDFEKSLSVKGDSGPYLQYTYARLRSILRKSKVEGHKLSVGEQECLEAEAELSLIRKLIELPDVIETSVEELSSSFIAKYLHDLANLANRFYESTPVMKEENDDRRRARLVLVEIAARILKEGLGLLGISAPERV